MLLLDATMARDLAELVLVTQEAQKEYFNTRDKKDLLRSKSLESLLYWKAKDLLDYLEQQRKREKALWL